MTSLLQELQREAADPDVRVDDLLRNAVEVATTLGSEDFRVWATKELQGYAGETTTPHYRRVSGVLKARHPQRGWVRVILPDEELQKRLESKVAREPISELEDLFHDPANDDPLEMESGPTGEHRSLEDLSSLAPMPYDWLMRTFGDTREYQPGTVPTVVISRPTIQGVLDAVRGEVLRWSRALEEQGVSAKD